MIKNFALGAALLCSEALAGLYIVNPTELKELYPGAVGEGKDHQVKDQGEIHSKLSNIGNWQTGTSRMGQVITPFTADGQGCEPFSWDDDFTAEEMTHFSKTEGFFLLLQRGGCSFMTKVKNAQDFGAEVVIVSDYKEAEWAEDEENKYTLDKNEGLLSMHIPAFEIDWVDAKNMVDFIHKGEQVVYVKATFDVTNAANTVEVDLWYATSLDLGLNLSTELAAMSLSFAVDHTSKPLFTPRIATFTCMGCAEDFIEQNCVSDGMYCGYTPNFYKEYDLESKGVSMTGREVLTQALREKCLHNIMSTKYKDEGDLYWTFFNYIGKCFTDDFTMNSSFHPKSLDECYDWSEVKIMDHEEVGNLNKCVDESFKVPGDTTSDNSILRNDRKWANANQITMHPSITVNNITYTNSTSEDLALAICAAYREAPDECELSWKIANFSNETFEGLMTPHQTDELVIQARNSHALSEGEIIFGPTHIIVLTIVVIGLNAAVLLLVRWRLKRQNSDQMNQSVNEAVTSYFALGGSDTQ